ALPYTTLFRSRKTHDVHHTDGKHEGTVMDQMDECITQSRQSNRGHLGKYYSGEFLESIIPQAFCRFMLPFLYCQICRPDHFRHIRPVIYCQADGCSRHRTYIAYIETRHLEQLRNPEKEQEQLQQNGDAPCK